MPKYKFRFNKKSIHLIIPRDAEDFHFDTTLKGVDLLKKSGYYTEDELFHIGNIPMATLMNMFREIV